MSRTCRHISEAAHSKPEPGAGVGDVGGERGGRARGNGARGQCPQRRGGELDELSERLAHLVASDVARASSRGGQARGVGRARLRPALP